MNKEKYFIRPVSMDFSTRNPSPPWHLSGLGGKLMNRRTGQVDTVDFPVTDWVDYIPQAPEAQQMYQELLAKGTAPSEAAVQVMEKYLPGLDVP